MSDTTISTNMSLIIPTVGEDTGPDWANNLNADLGILDQHDHSAGRGVPITPTGININANLPLNQNNLTTVNTVNYHNLSASLAGASPNLGCTYVAGGELYYNDEAGNVVKITSTGNVNAGAGSITGLPSGTASATYSSGTFVWQSATLTPANLDAGSVILRNITASSKGLTLNPPNAMAADYSINFPLLPASNPVVLALDSSGNIAGVTTAVDAIGANIIANSRTRTTGTSVISGGVAKSISCGAFATTSTSFVDITNLSVTITTTGRPVQLFVGPDGTANNGVFRIVTGGELLVLRIYRDATLIYQAAYAGQPDGAGQYFQAAALSTTDVVVTGTYTYKVQILSSFGTSVRAEYCKLTAYEL